MWLKAVDKPATSWYQRRKMEGQGLTPDSGQRGRISACPESSGLGLGRPESDEQCAAKQQLVEQQGREDNE